MERTRRDGAATSSDLLEYVETYHLTTMIKQNWEAFKQVFDDRQRTLVDFNVVEDVRNSIAHSSVGGWILDLTRPDGNYPLA